MTASPIQRTGGATGISSNFEKYAWLFMRLSGVVLLVLILVHVYVNLVMGDGVFKVDFAFVAGKYADPFWQLWDFAILWLSVLHGSNGVRVIIRDYVTSSTARFWLISMIAVLAAVMLMVGTYTIFTFDPCPAGAIAGDLPAFCPR